MSSTTNNPNQIGAPEFDWITELEKSIKQEPDRATYRQLCDRARTWPTCACGQLCKALPRREDGKPVDFDLQNLGIRFCMAIGSTNYEWALDIFGQIEARTAELMRRV
jgi:hypothetical protein